MFDEMGGSEGAVRPAYAELSRWLGEIKPDVLDFRRREAELFFRRIGITFAVYGDPEAQERLIPFDVIPRILSAAEWEVLQRGLEQRVTAINAYIKEVMGGRFSAKDFRTWAGTLICACALARAGVDETENKSARKKKIVAAIKETAENLGNTPAICRASYIYPAVISSYDRGRVIGRYFENVEELVKRRSCNLHGAEKALVELLKKAS